MLILLLKILTLMIQIYCNSGLVLILGLDVEDLRLNLNIDILLELFDLFIKKVILLFLRFTYICIRILILRHMFLSLKELLLRDACNRLVIEMLKILPVYLTNRLNPKTSTK